jgi:hypothetical protein
MEAVVQVVLGVVLRAVVAAVLELLFKETMAAADSIGTRVVRRLVAAVAVLALQVETV